MLDWEIALLPMKIKTQMWEDKDPKDALLVKKNPIGTLKEPLKLVGKKFSCSFNFLI